MDVRHWLALTILWLTPLAGFASEDATERSDTRVPPSKLADKLLASLELVLTKHVDPPTRDELLRRGVTGMLAHARIHRGSSLGRTISELDDDGHAKFLQEMVVLAASTRLTDEQLVAGFLGNLLTPQLPATGAVRVQDYIPASNYRVAQQLRENRYVGIGIQLGRTAQRPTMVRVLPGGPAMNGGGKNGDMIMNIDGTETEGMSLTKAIELLRGLRGEPVTIVVQQPNEEEPRTLELVRGEVPFETVVGQERKTDGWHYHVEPRKTIAYVRLDSIRGSTVGELRQTARRLQTRGYRAWILDLRRTQDGDLRHAIMVADELVAEASLGTYTDASGEHDVASSAQNLLPDWPMAVLVESGMGSEARWIAAALQDNDRATVVGVTTSAADWYAKELLPMPAGGALLLPTARLNRPTPLDLQTNATVTQWQQGAGRNGAKFTQREVPLRDLLRQGGARKRLFPDHFVVAPRLPGAGNGLAPVNGNVVLRAAIELLKQRVELASAE